MNIAYEEWRSELDEDEIEFEEHQATTLKRHRLERLYAAVGTFEPKWQGNIRFFDVKFMQDRGLKSIFEN